jgi:hypothetical protein
VEEVDTEESQNTSVVDPGCLLSEEEDEETTRYLLASGGVKNEEKKKAAKKAAGKAKRQSRTTFSQTDSQNTVLHTRQSKPSTKRQIGHSDRTA